MILVKVFSLTDTRKGWIIVLINKFYFIFYLFYMYDTNQKITVKPELKGFFIVYLISAIPGIISSFLWLIVIALLVIGSFGAIGASKNTGNSASGMDTAPLSLSTTASKGSDTDSKILVYELNGAIQSGSASGVNSKTGIYTDSVSADFKKIKEDKTIKNIVFKFNSPGGEVFASQILGNEIKDLMANKNVNTGTFYFDQLAASGALLATYKNPNYVFANPYGETGSIGVRLELANLEKLADNIGYKQVVIKAGENKDLGNPFRTAKPEELAYFQKMVDSTYAEFTNTVAVGRKLDLEKVKGLANGFVYFNDEAKNNGLIDELASIDKAVEKAASESNITSYKTVKIQKTPSILEGLGIGASVSSLLGISQTTIDKLNSTTSLKAGTVYAIDETKM
jgi:protease IV